MRGTSSEGAGLATGSCTGSGVGVGLGVDVGDAVHAPKPSNTKMVAESINSLGECFSFCLIVIYLNHTRLVSTCQKVSFCDFSKKRIGEFQARRKRYSG